VDAGTGNVLAAKDPHRPLPPASTIKVLTALTLMPRLDLDSYYSATLQDVNQPGTRIGLRAGKQNKVYDLFAGMMMNSGNDAASAVANAAGGWDQALEWMNEEARRVGAVDTVAETPNGLDRHGQVTTAVDLAAMFRAALQLPELVEIMQTKQLPAETVDGRTIPLYNHNKLLQLNYPGHLGAKTGTTSMAGKTVVSAFLRDGRTLIFAMMRYGGYMERVSKPIYDWGFANADRVVPVEVLPAPGPAPQVTPAAALMLDQLGNSKEDSPKSRPETVTTRSTSDVAAGGDSGSLGAWILLVAVAGGGIAVALRRRRQSSLPGARR
jgi:D-alanyl-D-alanine carboxypeptidase (penicillin-binding protein 5/6)